MNKFLLLLVLCSSSLCVKAQVNEIEAKAAYLLAEERYGKGDYQSALKFLDKAKASLGVANSKILYLKIQTELELYKKDKSYYSEVIQSIADFQTSPDIKDFNQEKVLEVVKAKMAITDEREKEIAKEEAVQAKKRASENYFKQYSFVGWPFGVSFEALKTSHKDRPFFQKRGKDRKEKDIGMVLNYHSGISFIGTYLDKMPTSYVARNIFGIITKDDIVKGYRNVIYHQNNKTTSLDQSKVGVKSCIDTLTSRFGFAPVYKKGEIGYPDQYRWTKDNKTVTLYVRLWRYKKGWTDMIVQEILVN